MLGAEKFTVGMLEDKSFEVLPLWEIVFSKEHDFPIYSYESENRLA